MKPSQLTEGQQIEHVVEHSKMKIIAYRDYGVLVVAISIGSDRNIVLPTTEEDADETWDDLIKINS